MTTEQKKEIKNYLLDKRLPTDLLVEIEDHMTEQIDFLMKDNYLDFEVAFQQSQNDWKDELRLRFSFLNMKQITNFQRKISNTTRKTIMQKVLIYFMPFVLVSFFLLFYNKEYASYYFLMTFIIITVSAVFLSVKDYRIIKNTGNISGKNISYLQYGAGSLLTAAYFIPTFLFLRYDAQFNTFYKSFQNIINREISFRDFITFSFFYVYIFASIIGFFYFIEYKKTIGILERKIGLKL